MNVKAKFVTSAGEPKGFPPADRPEVALAGRSNVGKSSLINRLVGVKGLAVVSKTPGRTRLVNFFDCEVEGRSLRLVDLPGYGFAAASKSERAAWRGRVESYLATRASLLGVVHLLDIRHDPSALDRELAEWLASLGRARLQVFTKADKLSRNQARTRARKMGSGVLFSSLSGEGREDLWKAILDLLERA